MKQQKRHKAGSAAASNVPAAPEGVHAERLARASASKPASRSPLVSFRDLALGALLFGMLLFAYLPALKGGLLWDDDAHITRPALQSLSGLWRIWTQPGATQQYYPLLHTAFWVEYQAWGDALLGYHLINLVLHAGAAFLLVAILRRLAIPGAWLAAFLFAIHPVQVETVAWIAEQKNTLSTVFYLASALVYLHFDQSRKRRDYFAALGLFLLALMSKSVTATLPAALLVVLWWQRERLDYKRDIRPLAPWLAVGACAGLVTAHFEQNLIGAQGKEFALTFVQRFLLAGKVICFYAGKLIWPADLTFIYPRWNIDARDWQGYLFPAAVVMAAAALVYLARRHRAPLAGFLFFVGTLFPALGFLNVYPFRFSYVADHFQYVACLGIIVPVAAALALAGQKMSGVWKPALSWTELAFVFALAILTWTQTPAYRNAEALYRETIARNPQSWMAHSNLAGILMQQRGKADEAMREFQVALKLNPNLPEAHNNLGLLLSDRQGREADAIREYRAALALKPDFSEAHNNLGSALADDPNTQGEALAEYAAALRINPGYAEAYNNLGSALSNLPGHQDDAIREFEQALRLKPDLAEAQANLGVALLKIPGRVAEATAHLQTALQLRPDMQKVRQILAEIEQQQRLADR